MGPFEKMFLLETPLKDLDARLLVASVFGYRRSTDGHVSRVAVTL